MDLRLVHSSGTELTCNKSTQLHDAFIGHARQRHDLIGCSETTRRTFGVRRVVNTCTPTRLFTLESTNSSSPTAVQFRLFGSVPFMCCEQTLMRKQYCAYPR